MTHRLRRLYNRKRKKRRLDSQVLKPLTTGTTPVKKSTKVQSPKGREEKEEERKGGGTRKITDI